MYYSTVENNKTSAVTEQPVKKRKKKKHVGENEMGISHLCLFDKQLKWIMIMAVSINALIMTRLKTKHNALFFLITSLLSLSFTRSLVLKPHVSTRHPANVICVYVVHFTTWWWFKQTPTHETSRHSHTQLWPFVQLTVVGINRSHIQGGVKFCREHLQNTAHLGLDALIWNKMIRQKIQKEILSYCSFGSQWRHSGKVCQNCLEWKK